MAADSWGLSWGGTSGAWLSSWSGVFVPPAEPEAPAVTPAGRKRRRYYVEIDGQQFDVESADHAQQLLNRARALAEQAAETKAKKVEAKAARAQKPRPIRIEAPRIAASPELGLDLGPLRAYLAKTYDSAAAMAELRVLLARALEEQEEEEFLLLM